MAFGKFQRQKTDPKLEETRLLVERLEQATADLVSGAEKAIAAAKELNRAVDRASTERRRYGRAG